jgi:hypothetical protein
MADKKLKLIYRLNKIYNVINLGKIKYLEVRNSLRTIFGSIV